MNVGWLKVMVIAFIGTLLGIWLFRFTSADEPMRFWGIVSCTSLGACLGCLLNGHSEDEFYY